MNTIRQRLTCRLFAGWTLVLIVGGSLAYGAMHAALTHQFDEILRAKAVNLSTIAEQRDGRIEMDPAEQFLREFDTNAGAGFFQIWNADGRVLVRSKSLRNGNLPKRFGNLQTPVMWNMPLPDGRAGRAIGFAFKPLIDGELLPSSKSFNAILVVAVGREDLDRPLSILRWVMAGSCVLILSLTAIIVPRLLRRELAPLNRLADQASQISANTLSTRFSMEKMPGELAPIGSRLNDFLQRLEMAFERERQFSNDLAHEFRTPIAELRSFAELAIKWPDSRDAETDRNVLAIALQMESVINRLLAIARGEQGQEAHTLETINLTGLVESVWQAFEGQAMARQLTLQKHIVAPLVLRTDPVLLRSILTNLISNAVEYAPSRTCVRLQSEVSNGHFALHVINEVENLSRNDLPHFFERFWRKDLARTGSSHSGLGLPLSRTFAACLGYTLNARFNKENHLVITLTGPAATK